ncbi:MAG: metallophosphoesterase [Oscillospiraceae bacterium]|nr:metallophosphoesterase [Oscillospiraceae bacterium]
MLLAILMCFSMLPTSLAADETQTDSETAENLVVTFETDEHTTVDLYYSKDNYETADETDVTSAYVRGKGSTEIDNSGEGQVNFKVNADEGYTYTVEVDPEDGYNNCKGEDETGVADIWRITKISSDLTVTITSAAESSEGDGTESGEASATAATILNTTDVHTYIDEDITYSLAAGYRDTLENVLLVDAGDHVQGTAYGGMDNGQTIIELMNAAGYDLATLGNHEFDYGMDGAMNAIEWADFPYVSCNFYNESNGVAGDLVLDAYKVFEVNGISIAFVGITTPESFTKSTPKYFQDDDGNYIYGIAGGESGEELYEYVQKAIDAAAEEADYVIALGHLGDAASSSPWTSEEVIANTTGLDAFIDGHSHSTVEMKTIADKDGNAVVLTQTGSYFKALGQMTISEDGTITTELLDADDLADVEKNAEVEAIDEDWIADVDEQLGAKLAETDIDFPVYYEDGSRAVRKSETNMGDLNADAYYWYINEKEGLDCDLAVMNGGGVRASIDAGDWTYLSCKTVNTFGNVLCVVEVSGQAILDALEFGARFTPDAECGGFLQIAGASYEIDTSIANTVQVDDKSIWTGAPTGDYRVTNVKIYNKETGEYEALELDKTYTIAGTNYTLRDCGDGFDMFGDSVLVKDYITEDYLALAAYLQSFADSDGNGYADVSTENSPLAAYEGYLLNYESSTGAGRITNITGADKWVPTDLVVNIGAAEDSISVVWYDTSADAGTLTFGGKEYTADISAASREGYYVNRVSVTDLQPSTDYTYTITSGDGETSQIYTYTTTAFGEGKTFSFAIVGDPQIGASGNADSDTEGWAAAVEAMLADGTAYSFLFSMGDQVNSYYKADASNSAAVESEYDGYLSAAGLSGIAMATIVGNHDAGGNTTAYSDHFAMPNVSDYGKALNDNYSAGYLGDAAATVDSDGAADYYFTYNGVLFMVLNSSNESIAEHKEFMEKTIEANPDVNWTVVAFHKSIYSVASHVTESDIETLRNGLSPIFADLGIDIVLQGHDHVYARSYVMGGTTGMEAQDTESGAQSDIYNADGVVYVTFNSASGSKYYNITNEAFTYTAVMNQEKVQNYSTATVTEDSFTVTTYRVTDGSVVDTFTLHKSDEAEWTPTDLVVNIGAAEDSISVVWYDTSADAGTLTFGGKEYTADISAASREGYYVNRVSVTDLQPSTDYTYTITSGDGETSQIYTYTTTAFGEGKTFSFAIVGDPQIGASGNADSDTEGWNTAVNTILSNGTAYSFLFSMGDQVNAYYGESSEYAGYSAALTAAIEAYDESTDGEYIAYLVTALGMSGTGYEEYITNALQSVELAKDDTDVALILKTMGISGNNGDDVEAEYDGYLSPTGLSGIAMATVVGNHDAGNDNSALYTDHYSMPNVTEYGENQEGDGDYYFTYNGVLFMVLNSSNLSIAEHKTFLEETLEANPDATWNVVAFHKSIYSVASHVTESDIEALRLGLAPIFVDLGIDIVLQGHDHVYARSYVMGGANGMTALDTENGAQSDIYNADGVVYVTFNSASGSKFYNITNEAFTYTAVQNQEKVANYSTATVTEDSFTVTTYRVTDGSVVDTFTLHKSDEQSESVTPPEGDVKIAVISDDHLYDTTLGASGSAFEAYLAGDRKLLAESEAILDSALATIAESGVDYLLISGDLTKDGERQNHELLAEKLAAFEAETGISVFVTNGNHDISNSNAVSFDGDTTTRVETIDTDDFRTIYADFGYSEAVAVDTNSLSYAVNLGDDYRLIVIDSCKYNDDKDNPSQETGGEIAAATMTWVLAQIKAAVKDGRRPIGMMHHGLVSHTDIEPEMFSEYLVDDYESVAATLADAGLNLVFTGHFHSQDVAVTTTASGSTLYDVETGSLVTSPCPIRYVSLTGSTFSYTTDHVTEAEGIDNFTEYADEFLMNGLLGLTSGYKAISVTLYGTTYTADELLAEGFAAHYAGAEQIDYKTQKIIAACAEAAAATDNETMAYYYNLLAWALTALYTDSEGDDLEAAALTLTALPSYSSGSSGSGSGHAGSSTSTSTTTTTTTTDTTADTEITAEDVKAALSIEVSDSTVETLLGLPDVALDGYYYDALAWAVENGVTTGTSDTTFSPNIGCTRAQVVTFLYRAAGSPEVENGTVNPFTDVDSDAYYCSAVLWAVEQGITLGTSETTFSPDNVCSRAQIVTFLYRAAGSPEVDDSADSAFTDVSSSAYYCNAVLWAAQQGITLGTSETTFSPDDDCTRAQIVTFMFRYMA